MTRALVTQLFEALLQAVPPDQQEERFAGMQAITAACEYLATEPSGERAELIANLNRIADEGMADYANTGYPNSSAIRKSADMLEADAQPKSFIRERAQLEQE